MSRFFTPRARARARTLFTDGEEREPRARGNGKPRANRIVERISDRVGVDDERAAWLSRLFVALGGDRVPRRRNLHRGIVSSMPHATERRKPRRGKAAFNRLAYEQSEQSLEPGYISPADIAEKLNPEAGETPGGVASVPSFARHERGLFHFAG